MEVKKRCVMQVKILDRYIAFTYLNRYLLGIVFFSGMLLVSQALNLTDTFIKRGVGVSVCVRYFLCEFPYYLTLCSPVSGLIAALFTFGELDSSRELVAMRTSGVGRGRIIAPVILLSFGLSVLSLVWSEVVVPPTSARAKWIKRSEIQGRDMKVGVIRHITFFLKTGQFVVARDLVFEEQKMRDVMVCNFGPEGLVESRIDAEEAVFGGGGLWYCQNGIERKFGKNGVLSFRKFDRMKINLSVSPDEMREFEVKRDMKGYEMGLFELMDYVSLMKRLGQETREREIEFHTRFSFPFANIIITLFGASFSVLWSFQRKIASFGIGLLIIFLYWVVMAICSSLGASGVLGPILAAWGSNILFLGFGAGLIWVVKRG